MKSLHSLAMIATFVVALADFAIDDKPAAPPPQPVVPAIQWEVYFSPRGGCTDAIVREIDAACDELLVQAFSFTSTPITQAITAAHQRGIRVQVVLDDSNRNPKTSTSDDLVIAGVPTWFDHKHAIMHNKIAVIDRSVTITGSFNFTAAAERSNAENVLIVRDPALASRYRENFLRHLDHSERAAAF